MDMVPSGGNFVNSNAVVFPWSRCRWGTIVAVGLREEPGGGDMLRIKLSKPQAVDVSEQLEIPARSLVVHELQDKTHTIWQTLQRNDL